MCRAAARTRCRNKGMVEEVRAVSALRREQGVAMTEFALILPVFVVIIAGLLGFGRVFFYWISANHLANETARWAAVDSNPYGTSLQEYARLSATQEFADGAVVCITLPDGAALGSRVSVKVETPFDFIPVLEIAPIMIRGTSTMRIERLAGPTGTEPATYTPDDPDDPDSPCAE